MLYEIFVSAVIVLYIVFDINYWVRTYFSVISGRLFGKHCRIDEETTAYGISTLQDCDIWFRSSRDCRIVRDLDFARFSFYDQTGIYKRSQELNIKSLQGSTLIVTYKPILLFTVYTIKTKLIYWEDRCLYFTHEVETIHDKQIGILLISQQYGLSNMDPSLHDTAELLLKGQPGYEPRPTCPEYLQHWLRSQQISKQKLRNKKN